MDGLSGGGINGIIGIIILVIIPLVFAITLHEAAHGWVAKQFGDKTAYLMGRVSLNPARHISWFGTVILPLLMITFSVMAGGAPFVFGWAKPVPVNWSNLSNLRVGKAFVALAGPAANIVMAFFWALVALLSLMGLQGGDTGFAAEVAKYFYLVGRYGVMINVILCLLNLIPIPPLDGSRVISAIIPNRWSYYYDKVEPYGIWILLALIFLGGLRYILFPPANWTIQSILSVFGLR